MKWVVDMELEVTLKKSVVVESATARGALSYVEELSENMTGVIGSEETAWDELDVEGNEFDISVPVPLLDRRTTERRSPDYSLSDTHCDNCDATGVHTVTYGDARVCDACLKILPALVG